MELPNQLKERGIKFVLLEKGGKKPFQKDWTNKNIEFDNPELMDHLSRDGNYGVMGGGEKNLVIVDFDNEQVQGTALTLLPATFTVKTGRGLLHLYYWVERSPESYKGFDEQMNTLFDVQGNGKQVVGPGSLHPNGNRYSIIKDMPIQQVSYSELKAILMNYDRKPKKEIIYDKPKVELTENFIDTLKRSVIMRQVLESFSVDTSKNPTSCLFHASSGGKCLGFNNETAHCFHCVHPEQDVFTLNGIKKISEVQIGDVTINAKGEQVLVSKITKHNYSGSMLSIFVNGNNQPLKVTGNHGMYYYKDIKCNANYCKGNSICKPECSHKLKKQCRLWKDKSFEIVGKVEAKHITTNDALFFPIPKRIRDKDFLDVSSIILSSSNLGPKRKKIKQLPLSKDFLWVIGMYLAEGNSFRGGIKFSLHTKEKEYAQRIINTFQKELGLKGKTFHQTTSTGESLLVHICNTDLSEIFPRLFGKGCENKKVPRELLELPLDKCKSLLEGIIDGDGSSKDGTIIQTSKQLKMESYELALKTGYNPSMGLVSTPKEKKQAYMMYPGTKGIGKAKRDDNLLMPVNKIESEYYCGEVYDITVDAEHHSFLTPQGIVGNCDNSWNIFSLVKQEKNCSFYEAMQYLAALAGLSNEFEVSRRKYIDSIKDVEKEEMRNIREQFLELLHDKKQGEATEVVVRWILKKNFIFTTRDDAKPECWMYDKGIYVPNGRFRVKEILRDLLEHWYSTYNYNLILAKLEADTGVEPQEFFNHSYLDEVPVANGILNLKTRELKPFTPEKIFFNKLPVEYDSRATCPQIEKFVKEVLSTEDDKDVFYEIGGFCLWKEYKFEKAFMFVGGGRNGKDKSLELIKRLLGINNCCSVPLASIKPDSFIISEFHNRMANLAGEVSNQDLKDASAFKGLVGRSLQSATRKFLKPVTFVNHAKFIFACNNLPMVYENDVGFWNRWVMLEYPYTFYTQKEIDAAADKTNLKLRDEDIITKITTPPEMSGLLNKFLDGLDRLMNNKQFSSTRGSEEVKRIWIRKSNSCMAFCMDFVKEAYGQSIVKKDFRRKYIEFCKEHKVIARSDTVIKKTLDELYGATDDFRTVFDRQERLWDGIAWK